jgi:uncharacterized protein
VIPEFFFYGERVSMLTLAKANLLSPPVLGFGLGAVGTRLKSDLKLPAPLPALLSTYLLLAIGLKGGTALAKSSVSELAVPALATLGLGIFIPLVAFFTLHRIGRLETSTAAAMAAFYGSVSAVTFTAAMTFMERGNFAVEGFLPSLLAILEIPGIVVALMLAAKFGSGMELRTAMHEVLTGRSILLLTGGIAIGALSGADGAERVAPFFVAPFQGVLVLFLLDLGARATEQLGGLRKNGSAVVTFAILAPIVFGPLGVAVGTLAGLGIGGAAVLGAMAASASYIAAPAAVKVALPEVDIAVPLTAALAITFPFNLIFGIPIYTEIAQFLA